MKKTKMNGVDEMTQSKNQLIAERDALTQKINDILEKENKAAMEPLIGKCFRYRNSFGSGMDSWRLYAKVVDVCKGELVTVEFERTSNAESTIRTDGCAGYNRFHAGSNWMEITPALFNAELKKFRQHVNAVDTYVKPQPKKRKKK